MFAVQSFNTDTLERTTVQAGIATRAEARKIMRQLQRTETTASITYCVVTK